jgi:hypothetical protein
MLDKLPLAEASGQVKISQPALAKLLKISLRSALA